MVLRRRLSPALTIGVAMLATSSAVWAIGSPDLPTADILPKHEFVNEAARTPIEKDSTLSDLSRWIGVPYLTDATTVSSTVVGGVHPVASLPPLYVERAQGQAYPLRDAIVRWSAVLEIHQAEDLLSRPELYAADSLDRDLQIATAALLYAMTDATALQKNAVANLSPEDYARLRNLPDELVRAVEETGSPSTLAQLGLVQEAANDVDLRSIQAAAQVTASTLEHVLPALRAWGTHERASGGDSSPVAAELKRLLDGPAVAKIESRDPLERLDAFAEAFRFAAASVGFALSSPSAPSQPSSSEPLTDAIRQLLSSTGFTIEPKLLELELRRVSSLPSSLQTALATLIQNYAIWADALNQDATNPVEKAARARTILDAQLRFIAALRETAPVIEAWGLVLGHGSTQLLPKNLLETPYAIDGLREVSQSLSSPAAGLQEVVRMASALQGGPAKSVPPPPLPPRGALTDAIIKLYELLGSQKAAELRPAIQDAILRLPEPVERNAARILFAQFDAVAQIQELYRGLSAEELAILSAPDDLRKGLESGTVTVADVARLRQLYELVGRVVETYYASSLRIAAALDASRAGLADFLALSAQPPQPPENSLVAGAVEWIGTSWIPSSLIRHLVADKVRATSGSQQPRQAEQGPLCVDLDDFLVDLDLVQDAFDDISAEIWLTLTGTLQPVGALFPKSPVPPRERDYEMSRCDQDILFQDPVLETVVITGLGRTVYDPRITGVSHQYGIHRQPFLTLNRGLDAETMARGQLLSIDLGGDDTYLNNAGGGMLTFFVHEAFRNTDVLVSPYSHFAVDPAVAAVALDLSGDDYYKEPPPGTNLDGIQGAGLGGIGFLWDLSGNDVYAGRRNSQGFGGGFVEALRPDFPCLGRNTSDVVTGNIFGNWYRLHPFCLYGLHGIGVLLDSNGDDRYAAYDASQGFGGPSGTNIPISELGGLAASFGGFGALVDLSGSDQYALINQNDDGPGGQGAGDTGFGFLLDASGADVYRGGSQGRARNGGLGTLIDLGNQDRYTRTNDVTGSPFRDGDCAADLDLNTDNRNRIGPISVGVFVDAMVSGSCRLTTPIDPGATPDPDELLAEVLAILDTGFVDGDRDGWVQTLEEGTRDVPPGLPGTVPRTGWDDEDSRAYPAGLPRHPPPAWPEGAPWPPSTFGHPIPYGSPFLVHVPPLLVVGDGIGNIYPRTEDFVIQLDVGGEDTYLNRAAGASTVSLGTPQSSQPILIDFGLSEDFYLGPAQSQAFNGFLFEFGGDDIYSIEQSGQGVVDFGGLTSWWSNAGLFDAAGNDTYTVEPRPCPRAVPSCQGTGFFETAAHATVRHNLSIEASGFAVLVDAAGNDTYHSGRQAVVEAETLPLSPVTALFMDLAGEDVYSPTHRRGEVLGEPRGHHTSIFADAAGWDAYRGIVFGNELPDLSALHNNRVRGEVASQARSQFALDQDRFNQSIQPTPLLFHFPSLGIGIGNPEDTEYWNNYALLIDPGGEDHYHNNAGATLFRAAEEPRLTPTFSCPPCAVDTQPGNSFPVAALLVDLEGDDVYDATDVPGLSVAASEVGLIPISSHPVPTREPQPATLVQGAGFLGVGILVDDIGDDVYRARSQAQGFGLLGAGILWDRSGDDDYGYGPEVVAEPEISGRLAVWRELRKGKWELMGRFVDPISRAECDFSPTLPEFGGNIHGAVVDRGRIAYSFRDEKGAWKLTHITPTFSSSGESCTVTFDVTHASKFRSSQINPTYSGSRLAWQDDRNGDQDLYWRDMTNGLLLEEPLFVGPGNQVGPEATDEAVVWQDDRSGLWSVWLMDTETRLAHQISPPDGSHTRPDVSNVFVVWQVTRGDAQGTNIMVLDRIRGSLREIEASGDQTNPTVSGATILYEDRSLGYSRVFKYDFARHISTLLRDRGSVPRLDPEDSGRFVWIDQAGQDGEEVGAPYWLAIRSNTRDGITGDIILSKTVVGREYNSFLQGSAWQFALGMLLDQSGLDRYDAGANSQGHSLSLAAPVRVVTIPVPVKTSNLNYQQAASGVLADLEGNDVYRARSNSQGAQISTPLEVAIEVNGNALPGFYHFSQNVGILLDARGSDAYSANQNSQGYGGWSYHLAGPYVQPAAPLPQVVVRVEADVVNSFGTFVDLGGTDRYEYRGDLVMAGIPDCHGLPNEVRALVASLSPFVGDQCSALSPDSPPPRHNSIWHNPALAATLNPNTAADASPRGLGVDAPVADVLDEAFRQQADEFYDLEISAHDLSDGSLVDRLDGDVLLTARLTEVTKQELLEVKRLEFFIDDAFAGYGKSEAGCPGAMCWSVPWTTDVADFPDALYEVRVLAHLGLRQSAVFGGSVGYINQSRVFRVDNPPRLLNALVAPTFFSPHPFSADPEIPSHPIISFGLTPEPSLAGGYGFAQVRVLRGEEEVRRLREFSTGQIEDSELRLVWDGFSDSGEPSASGGYLVEILATDRLAEPNRRSPVYLPLDVDRDSPTGSCLRLAASLGCAPEVRLNLENSNFQEATGLSVAVFSVSSTEPSSIRRLHTFVRENQFEEWTYETSTSTSWTVTLADGDEKRVVTLAEDFAGNLECHPVCGARSAASGERGSMAALEAARDRKLSQPTVPPGVPSLVVRADLARPLIMIPPTFYSWNDRHARLDDVPRVNAQEDLGLRFDVREFGSFAAAEPLNASLLWESFEDPRLVQRVSAAIGADPQEAGRYHVTWADWPALIAAWPSALEGPVGLLLDVRDAGGNHGELLSGQILLDNTAPVFDDVAVEYPDGRRNAIAGDEITIRARVRDPAILGFEVPQKKLDVRLNATAFTTVSQAEDIRLSFDAALGEFITVPPVRIVPPPELAGAPPTTLAMRLRAADISENVREVAVPFVLGEPQTGLEFVSEDIGVREARLEWSSKRNATVELQLTSAGSPDLILGPTALGLRHAFELENLHPGTEYTYRLTARDAAGALETVAPRSFLTSLGLDLFVESPQPGQFVSGLADVVIRTDVEADPLARPRVTISLRNDSLPSGSKLVADDFSEDGVFVLGLVSDALPDGVYDMEVRVEFQAETVREIVSGFIIDNHGPNITWITPEDSTVLSTAPKEIIVDVSDAFGRIVPESVQLRVNGEAFDGVRGWFQPKDGLREGRLVVRGLPSFPEGELHLSILVEDQAGNVGAAAAILVKDATAPAIKKLVVEYPENQGAVRSGQWIGIRVQVEDDVAVQRAILDARNFHSPSPIDLVREGEWYRAEFPIEDVVEEGLVAVNLDVFDTQGNIRRTEIAIRVDNRAPMIQRHEMLVTSGEGAHLVIDADETVTVRAVLSGNGLDIVAVPETEPVVHGRDVVLRFDGLQAGQAYRLQIEIRDNAGNILRLDEDWVFATALVPPPPVEKLSATILEAPAVLLRWETVGHPSGAQYVVFRAAEGPFEQMAVVLTPTYQDDSVQPGLRYTYFVQGRNLVGDVSPPSALVLVDVPRRLLATHHGVHPEEGLEGSPFVFRLDLAGARSRAPAAWLVLDGIFYKMDLGGSDSNCQIQCTFFAERRLAALDLRTPRLLYYAEVFDAGSVVRIPSEGFLSGPIVLVRPPGAGLGGPIDALPSAIPGFPAVVLLALGGAVGILRRKAAL